MASKEPIKVAITDDHRIFREGIKTAISSKPGLEIIWEATNGKELMQNIALKMPDVLLMDIRMPEIDGIQALTMLRNISEDLKIIILSSFEDEQMVCKMMELGANSYLPKSSHPEDIYAAIITCMNDRFYFNSLVNNAVIANLRQKRNQGQFGTNPMLVSLKQNEIKILELIADDKTTAEIASLVFLSPRTVEHIRQNMKTRVGAKTMAGLLMHGVRNKWIS